MLRSNVVVFSNGCVVAWLFLFPVFQTLRESERKRKRKEEGGSLSESVYVMRNVVNGGRKIGGSAKRQRR